LPIVLALILPGLSLLTDSGLLFSSIFGFIQSWIVASIIVYILWYTLWFSWDFRKLREKWWLITVLIILIGILLGTYFLYLYDSRESFEWIIIVRIVIGITLFLTIQYALRTQLNISRLQLEKEQIQTENYKAQLKALRAQIDPHFLFNSLNTLRSMVRHKDSKSEQFVMSLSDFYRQTLKHNEDTTLPLEEEIDVMQSYFFLMKSRNEDAVFVEVNIDRSLLQHHLPTMALQIIVENCFKHNSMSSKSPLHIEITNTDDFYIMVCNNIQPKFGEVESTGHGLELLRKKYELMKIPQGLLIDKTAGKFCIKLKLI
jgi:LytS/YehU family sensor histidine kinase